MKRKIFGLSVFVFFFLITFGCATSIHQTTKSKVKYSISSKDLEKLKINYPDLYKELFKLPDIKENTDKNKKAMEQIARLGLSNKNKASFDLLLNEGLKEKRKYCAPLEALLWLACDSNFDKYNPLAENTFTVSAFMQNSWQSTSTSKHFTSERWSDFSEVADRLNSPLLIDDYMRLNISYSYTPYEKEGIKSAGEIFKDKKGACYDQALLAGYLLKRNGYDKVWGMFVTFKNLVNGFYGGHVGIVYMDPNDNQYYSMDFNRYHVISGPFTSLEEVAKHISFIGSDQVDNLKTYKCFEIHLPEGKYVKTSDYFSE